MTRLSPSRLALGGLYGLTILLIVKVTLGIVWNYKYYFPANFESDFLRGREDHFHGFYRAAFYIHLISTPPAILACLILLSNTIRRARPRLHRTLGRIVVFVILLGVVPSGAWMAWRADGGMIAFAGFIGLACALGLAAWLGGQRAMQKDFAAHRRWMTRSFLLLTSAVWLRLIAGAATVLEFDSLWLYPASAWLSWIAPLAVFEAVSRFSLSIRREH
jgi:uncharacterized membrane protein